MLALVPGLAGCIAAWNRFPNSEPLYLDELSHYLSAVERLRYGQVPVRDFVTMFSPGFPDLLRVWLAIVGDSVAATHGFFLAGWALYLVVLGLLAHGAGLRLRWTALLMVAFATWSLPVSRVINSWGGARYLPGLLILFLMQQWILRPEIRHRVRLLVGFGFILPFAAVVALEQVLLALAAAVVMAVLAPQLRRPLLRRDVLMPMLGGVLLGLLPLALSGRAELVLEYLRVLPRFAFWRQPLRPTDPAVISFLLTIPALTYVQRWRDRHRLPPWSSATVEQGVLLFGIFATLQLLYSLRAFYNVQGALAIGLVLVWTVLAVMTQQRLGGWNPVLLGCLLLTPVIAHGRNPTALQVAVSRWQANLSGQQISEFGPRVPSQLPRLAGTQLLLRTQVLDSLVRQVHQEWTNTADSSYLVYPDWGVLEYLLQKPASTRFPILALAETTPAWRAEMIQELQAHPPHLILRQVMLGNFAKSIGRRTELFPEIPEMLDTGYVRIASFEIIELWRRRVQSSGRDGASRLNVTGVPEFRP